jgi:hypothetical protein
MKIGDLVELIYKEKNSENFLGIVTGFDSTDCAYIEHHNMKEKFSPTVAIPKNRLRAL